VGFDIGEVHNEILARFHERHDLTSNNRLSIRAWADLLLDSADDVYRAHGLSFDRVEEERDLIHLLQVANYIRESKNVDLRTIHLSQTPRRDFGRVLDQLVSVGLLAPEVATVVRARVDPEGGGPERLRSERGDAEVLAVIQLFDRVDQASGQFWGPLLDGHGCDCCPNCGDSRVRTAG
jgi:hypothetical protein